MFVIRYREVKRNKDIIYSYRCINRVIRYVLIYQREVIQRDIYKVFFFDYYTVLRSNNTFDNFIFIFVFVFDYYYLRNIENN